MSHLKVANLDASIEFYKKYLGFELIERSHDSYAILLNSEIDIKLVIENESNKELASHLKQNTISIQVQDKAAFSEIYKKLINDDIHVYPHDNIVSWSLIFSDPDKNQIDLYLDRRSEAFRIFSPKGANIDMKRERILSVLN